MVPALLHGGSPGYSKVFPPYFSLIWHTEVLGKLSYSVFMDGHGACAHAVSLQVWLHWHFFGGYQSCGFSSILAWMKKGWATTAVTEHTFFPCLISNTRTKFLSNEWIICMSISPYVEKKIHPSMIVQTALPPDCRSVVGFWEGNSACTSSAIQVYLCISALYYRFHFISLFLSSMHTNVNIFSKPECFKDIFWKGHQLSFLNNILLCHIFSMEFQRFSLKSCMYIIHIYIYVYLIKWETQYQV